MDRRAALVLVVPAVVAAAGCDGGDSKPTASPAARTAAPASTTPATPAGGALPQAADGTRLSACHKGRCEVLVSVHDTISPPARLGVPAVTVTSVSAHGVTYVGTGPGITLSLSGQRNGMTSYMNRLAITTVAVGHGQAVVRFAAR